MWPAWFTDCLAFLRLLFAVDINNITGVRYEPFISDLGKDWLEPQVGKVDQLRSEVKEKDIGFAADFILDRWEDALERVKEVVFSE